MSSKTPPRIPFCNRWWYNTILGSSQNLGFLWFLEFLFKNQLWKSTWLLANFYRKFRYWFVKYFRWTYLKNDHQSSARITPDVIRDFSRNRCHFYSMSYLFKHLTRSPSRVFLWTFCFCSITKTLGRGVGGLLEFHWVLHQ